jgi:DNA-binding LytR/AlgR family response regulator
MYNSSNIPVIILNSRPKQQIAIDQILFLEGDINYTHFHFESRPRATIAHCLKHFEADLLPNGFVRIHRSYIVNARFVRKTNLLTNTITLTDGTMLKVARRRVKELSQLIFLTVVLMCNPCINGLATVSQFL